MALFPPIRQNPEIQILAGFGKMAEFRLKPEPNFGTDLMLNDF